MRGVEVSESAASDRAPAGASRGERSLVTGQQTAGPVRTCPAAAAVTSVDRSIAGAPCGLARLAFDCKVASCTIIELTPWTVDENASTFHLCSYSAPDGGAEYCDERVCLSLCVCVFVCPRSYLRKHASDLHQFFMHVTYDHGSILLWRRSDMLRTSGL